MPKLRNDQYLTITGGENYSPHLPIKMSEEPFIKKLKTKDNFYIYDVNTNNILKTDLITWSIIDDYPRRSQIAVENKWKSYFEKKSIILAISNLDKIKKEENLFSSLRPKTIRHNLSKKEIIYNLDNNINQLTLEITEKCNLRCTYCIYSGKFRYKRVHSDKSMSFDIAKRAIDFYIEHSKENEKPSITFYGGEPLCNFDLVKKCIEYAKSRTTKSILFGITTNGTLLSPRVSNYLLKNDCSITISLDGPQSIHDKYRVFPSGKGTYSIIMKNLKSIPSENISFNVTISPPYELKKIKDYFDHLSIGEREYMINITLVAKEDSSLFRCNKQDCFTELKSQIIGIRQEFKNNLIEGMGNRSPFLRYFFQKNLLEIKKRGIFEKFGDFQYPNRICIPGKRKLFVNTLGDFFICENMTDFRSIGNVFTGFNYIEIFNILDEYIKYCNIDCLDCWAIRLCNFCFVAVKKGPVLDLDRKRIKCKKMKERLQASLEFYLEILEKNPRAFDFLNDIIYITE